ncbi:prepilin peptidase [Demequina sp.]|uniref:prepilin peptidase n=1 Tax=Demequina sp. TaxID=2050685 RepID=UPI003D0A3802
MTLAATGEFGAVTWAIPVFVGLVGLIVGSFLNVVAWRVPNGQSIVSPPSACPQCGHEIRKRDNIPVLSWLILRGKCRDCGAHISAKYPVVELITGVLFVLVWWKFGLGIEFVAYAYLAAIAVALTVIDLEHHRLPDSLVLPSYAVLAVLFVAESFVTGDWWPLAQAAIGGVALFAFYFVAALVYPGGMGFGDVKLAGVLGMALGWLGWGPLVVGAFSAFIIGGIVGVALIAIKKAGRRSGVPFGPFMFAGAAVGIACGTQLWDAYTGIWAS